MYITTISRGKRKEKGMTMRRTTRSHGRGSWLEPGPMDRRRRPVKIFQCGLLSKVTWNSSTQEHRSIHQT
jgi:hypothetical protein